MGLERLCSDQLHWIKPGSSDPGFPLVENYPPRIQRSCPPGDNVKEGLSYCQKEIIMVQNKGKKH